MTFFGNSGPGDLRFFMTGLRGWRGFNDIRPADAANSRNFWEKPLLDEEDVDDVGDADDTADSKEEPFLPVAEDALNCC